MKKLFDVSGWVLLICLASCSVTKKASTRITEQTHLKVDSTHDSLQVAKTDSVQVIKVDSSGTTKTSIKISFDRVNDYEGAEADTAKREYHYHIAGKDFTTARPIKDIELQEESKGQVIKSDSTAIHQADSTRVKATASVEASHTLTVKATSKKTVNLWWMFLWVVVIIASGFLFYWYVWPWIAPFFRKKRDPINRHTQIGRQ